MKHTDSYYPGALDPEDEGEQGRDTGATPVEQDDAFSKAMLRAISRGTERRPVPTVGNTTTVRVVRGPTYVPTASSADL